MLNGKYILLSHSSARLYWKIAGSPHCPWGSPDPSSRFVDSHIDEALRARAFLECSPWLADPLEVLVKGAGKRRIIEGVTAHSLAGDLPRGSLYRLSDTVFVVSPELSFVQMGNVFSVAQLAAYGTELCSSYVLDPSARTIIARKEPVATLKALCSFLDKAGSLRGARRASKALKWVLEGAESPMEIKTAMLLCLPRQFGGYGLPAAQLNRTIRPGRAAHLVGQSKFRPDLSWPELRVAVEYDGKESHEDAHEDKRRINDLEHLGWKVFVATSHDFATLQASDKFATKVATAIGYRIRKGGSWLEENVALRGTLGIDWVEVERKQGRG